jgi:hypothetical protein
MFGAVHLEKAVSSVFNSPEALLIIITLVISKCSVANL